MFGTISHEILVDVPASEAWKIYGTLQMAKLAAKLLPDWLEKVDVVEGDGTVGTILKLTFPAGRAPFSYFKEKFIVHDDTKRLKVAEVVEGGYLDEGFTQYRIRVENIEAGENACITKCTVEYELDAEAAANISHVNIPFIVAAMNAIADYLTKGKE